MAERTAPEMKAVALIAAVAFLYLTAHRLGGAGAITDRKNEIGDAK
jgi:hypothetical protein